MAGFSASILLAVCFTCFLTAFAAEGAGKLLDDAVARRLQRRVTRENAVLRKPKPDLARDQARSPGRVSATDPQDKKALEDFYHATNGDQWTNNSKWMKGDPCQDGWYGIYCSESGKVLGLTLVYNLLSGSLPSSIINLSHLQVLMLYSNDIEGAIPAAIFTMSSLQTLDINDNQLSGTLPSTVSMGNLTLLNLYSNKIQGEMPTEWNTPNLQTLGLSSNMMTGSLPTAIGKLSHLTSLVLSRNKLSGDYPAEYGALSKLQQLWLFDNKFNKPKLPESWARLVNLVDIEFDGLSGEFPSWLGNWDKLENLVIVDGYLTGSFPTTLCSLKKVQYFHIFNNSLSGPLPNCICDLPQTLNSLELSDNGFSGPIPYCIGKLRNLTELYLSRNNFSGSLPSSLGDIHYLNVVDVSTNSITGSVPSSFAGLKKGTYGFFLCYNKLSSFEQGLEQFFDFIQDYTCALYENPWSCPLPSYVPKSCEAVCLKCNTGDKHTSCSSCVTDNDCGWCSEGPNCLDGTQSGPDSIYKCQKSNWYYGQSKCP